MQTMVLTNNVSVPSVGFGTFRAQQGADGVFLQALFSGYRHFDTASFYENETQLGRELISSGIARKELFLTSKAWRDEMGGPQIKAALERSCQRLGCDYLDLYLIHWPKQSPTDEKWLERVLESWAALEQCYRDGTVRAIGVSNFLPHHLKPLLRSCNVRPMVNQLEFHPGYVQWPAVRFCQHYGILVEAWSPLGRGRVLQEELLGRIGKRYGKTPAQICIRFALQCGVLPLPKSCDAQRMVQNRAVFDFSLTEEEVSELLSLPQMGWSGEHPDRPREVLQPCGKQA